MATGLWGRRVHIAGSANGSTDPAILQYSHSLIAATVRRILQEGGGLVIAAGKEPRHPKSQLESSSLVFDWTVLDAAAQFFKEQQHSWPTTSGTAIVVVVSEKSEFEIPEQRRELWHDLIRSGHVQLESIMPGATSGALIRERQAQFGNVLLILGGGTGVEHLADLYTIRHKYVIPLDLQIGASRGDGTGGAERLAREARAAPTKFIRLQREFVGQENARLAEIATRNSYARPDSIADKLVHLMTTLELPKAFYVRLMNRDHLLFSEVETFFRQVVDAIVAAAGYERVDMTADVNNEVFLNLAVFRSLHFASCAIVDVTAQRPNCFIELGYALAKEGRVIVTAREGTNLPFDQEAIPCHFWKTHADNLQRQRDLEEFWRNNIIRGPIMN